MTAQEYLQETARTESTPAYITVPGNTEAQNLALARLDHAAKGMHTESGEFDDVLKKHFIYGKPVDEVNLLEEIGDLLWYQALALRTIGKTFEDAMDANIRKLSKRYPEKFSNELALNRDLVAERAELERA